MPGQSSSPYGETNTGADSVPANATANSSNSISWAPHGRAMTACLVAVNVALVALVYLYFWRVFFRKRAASSSSAADADDEEDDGASSSASVPSSPARAQQDEEQQRRHDRLLASLPASFVARPGAGAGAECAVCIAELRDGDEARALPRCGHRFHAACVDAWLRRRHTTCPLCRASVVVAAAAEGAGPKGGGVTGTVAAAAAAEPEDVDAPV